jgi:hypothetical protein
VVAVVAVVVAAAANLADWKTKAAVPQGSAAFVFRLFTADSDDLFR